MTVSDNFTRFRMIWLEQILADKKINSRAYTVASCISKRFNRKEYAESGSFRAWPSYDTIAKELNITGRTVQRAVGMLKEHGHLMTKGAGGRHCSLKYYAIVKPKISTEDSEGEQEKGGHFCPPFDVTRDKRDKNVDISVAKRGHFTPQNVDKNVLLTSLNKTFEEPFEDAREPAELSQARAPIGVIVLSLLAVGPASLPSLPPFLRSEQAQEQFPELVMDHQAAHGWPDLHVRCQDPSLRSEVLARLAQEMEPVASDSDQWLAWKAEYRQRGWPMPIPLDGLACFPEGGPKKLDAFLSKVQRSVIDRAVAGSKNVVRIGGGR